MSNHDTDTETPTRERLQLLRKLATGRRASTRLAARMQLADAKALDDGPEMFADLCARVSTGGAPCSR